MLLNDLVTAVSDGKTQNFYTSAPDNCFSSENHAETHQSVSPGHKHIPAYIQDIHEVIEHFRGSFRNHNNLLRDLMFGFWFVLFSSSALDC